MTTNTTNKPVEKFQIGSVHASVWRNEGKDGKPFFKATFDNRYKAADGNYQSSTGFNSNQLVSLAKAALQAHSLIVKLSYAASQSDEDSGEEAA